MTALPVLGVPLAAVFLALVPVVWWLHRRRHRPPTVTVSSLAPWLQPGGAPRVPRRRVPPSVLLALHLAVALAVGLALLDPAPPGSPDADAARALIVDVTTSMAAPGRWAAAAARVGAVAGAGGGPTTLVALGPRPRVVVSRGTGAEVRSAFEGLAPGGTGADLAAAVELAAAAAGPGADMEVITDHAPADPAAAGRARLTIVGESVGNRAVTIAHARRFGDEAYLFARVANLSDESSRLDLSVSIDGRPVQRTPLDLAPDATHELWLVLPGSGDVAEVRIAPADALPEDDAAAVPIAPAALRVQLVGASEVLRRALAALPDVEVEEVPLGGYHVDGRVDASVFAGPPPELLPPGGVVAFGPAPGETAAGVRITASDHPMWSGLDLGDATVSALRLPSPPPAWASTVLEGDGGPVALAGTVPAESGSPGAAPVRVVWFGFRPEQGSVAGRLAFPLMVARAVAWSARVGPDGPPGSGAHPVGAVVDLPPGAVAVRDPDGTWHDAVAFFDGTSRPGVYRVRSPVAPGGRAFGVLAGDEAESDLREVGAPTGADDRATAIAPPPWWTLLVAAALGLLAVEAAWRAREGRSR